MLGTVKSCVKYIIEGSEKKRQNGVELCIKNSSEFHVMKYIHPQIQEALKILRRIIKKKTIPRNIIVKLKKKKDIRKLKISDRQRHIIFKATIRLTV